MKFASIIFLSLMLITQVGLVSLMTFSEEKETCEMLKDLTEEEEEDGESSKDFGESEILKEHLANGHYQHTAEEMSRMTYANNHPEIHRITLEVQTPPPENTMC